MFSRIPQQTWDQLGTQLLAAGGLVITIGNEVGWWSVGNDLQQNILGLGTIFLALAASLLYSANSTPNRVVDQMVAMAHDHGFDAGLAAATPPTVVTRMRDYQEGGI